MKEDIFNLDLSEFEVGKPTIKRVDFPSFYGLQKVKAPIYVYRASEEVSPCVVATSCMHGDEINGLGVTQDLMNSDIKLKKGTLIIVPILNIYGFLNKTRYLPDRKDLNRCFPGSENGSFGTRFAKFVLTNFLNCADVVVDYHSGGVGRFNIPQIRCDLKHNKIEELLEDLSIPLIVNSSLREGSLRETMSKLKKACIVFEGGEGLRIDQTINKYGVNLFKSILAHFDMIDKAEKFNDDKIIIQKTRWIRAKEGGVLLNQAEYGKLIKKGEIIGELKDIQGNLINQISSDCDGVILGMSKTALIMSGDPLYNIGVIGDSPLGDDSEEFYDYFDLDM